jgi:BirA family biotin operon repressor/biotin-[acetyl-CoA-carboxylase] ligase
LLKSLDREYRALLATPRDQAQAVIARFESASSSARGRRVRVGEDGGYEGTTEGLDSAGFLKVRTGGGTRVVMSGGVRSID